MVPSRGLSIGALPREGEAAYTQAVSPMASDFFELYKHPRWQAMRLKIMKRDEFTCEECGSTEEMLTVHHSYYERGKKPWEYPEQNLGNYILDASGNG